MALVAPRYPLPRYKGLQGMKGGRGEANTFLVGFTRRGWTRLGLALRFGFIFGLIEKGPQPELSLSLSARVFIRSA